VFLVASAPVSPDAKTPPHTRLCITVILVYFFHDRICIEDSADFEETGFGTSRFKGVLSTHRATHTRTGVGVG